MTSDLSTVLPPHLHFISEDRQKGGHILDFQMQEGVAEIDRLNKFVLIMPEETEGVQGLDLSIDRSHELEQVEK